MNDLDRLQHLNKLFYHDLGIHRLIGTTGAVQIVLGTLTEADLPSRNQDCWIERWLVVPQWAIQPSAVTERLDTEFRGTFLAGRRQDHVLDSCRTFPPLSRQDQRTEFAGIFSDNDAPRSGHKVSGNIPRENGPRSRQRILRKILHHFLSRSRQENPGNVSRKSRRATVKTATGIRPEKSRRFRGKIRTGSSPKNSPQFPAPILTANIADNSPPLPCVDLDRESGEKHRPRTQLRIGAPPPGPIGGWA